MNVIFEVCTIRWLGVKCFKIGSMCGFTAMASPPSGRPPLFDFAASEWNQYRLSGIVSCVSIVSVRRITSMSKISSRAPIFVIDVIPSMFQVNMVRLLFRSFPSLVRVECKKPCPGCPFVVVEALVGVGTALHAQRSSCQVRCRSGQISWSLSVFSQL